MYIYFWKLTKPMVLWILLKKRAYVLDWYILIFFVHFSIEETGIVVRLITSTIRTLPCSTIWSVWSITLGSAPIPAITPPPRWTPSMGNGEHLTIHASRSQFARATSGFPPNPICCFTPEEDRSKFHAWTKLFWIGVEGRGLLVLNRATPKFEFFVWVGTDKLISQMVHGGGAGGCVGPVPEGRVGSEVQRLLIIEWHCSGGLIKILHKFVGPTTRWGRRKR